VLLASALVEHDVRTDRHDVEKPGYTVGGKGSATTRRTHASHNQTHPVGISHILEVFQQVVVDKPDIELLNSWSLKDSTNSSFSHQ
jgi:hypothetical protein